VMEEKLDSSNAQLASVTKEGGFKIYSDEEVAKIIELVKEQEKEDEADKMEE
jgi:20S proteasome subunit alpha 5